MEQTVKVKDYIIDLNKVKESTITHKKSVAPKVDYSLILENDMDFVIKRKTSKTDKDLVFLVSQDLYYIKNNINDTVIQLDMNNYKRQISAFLRDMGMWINFEKVKWAENCYTENLYDMFANDTKRILTKHGINLKGYYKNEVANALKTNPKIVKYWFSKFNDINNYMLEAILYLNDKHNFNNAKYFIDSIGDLNTDKLGTYYLKPMLSLAKGYNCDVNTFIDYIVRGLYSQGIDRIDGNIYSDYRDYLSMTNAMKGKIKDKYPKYLKTEHDKVSMRYSIWKKYKNDLEIFKITEENKKLEFSDKKYSIILPETSSDIVDEGINQSHCVASYVERVANGDTLILFMRYTDIIDESLVTIEVKNNIICQAKGYANRQLSKEELDFIKRWAKINELKVNC
ncbi:PcfJ domain-containing protein [uncultured Clostridium sp.]|uniref:PcfJ domain-containing protein n=1 Tax=uncultured Clostridium sp. TaxID=59620 RepID=UPI002611CDCD|nr:PcfJ domain-containing protein [uncultured Clostridium sp.]